jgi:mono/diheme cytochrome c family protein
MRTQRQRNGWAVGLALLAGQLPLTAVADGAATPKMRGAQVFATYCSLCHGAGGKGDGRAAALQSVKPADLTVSRRSAEYKFELIYNGGVAMGRSSGMPPWRDALSREQIEDVVAYLQTLVATNGYER